jgi:hypothetical protein
MSLDALRRNPTPRYTPRTAQRVLERVVATRRRSPRERRRAIIWRAAVALAALAVVALYLLAPRLR